MPDFVIHCPTPACGKPLRLPDTAAGKPLACPHCRTPLRVKLGPDGTPVSVTAPDRLMRVPRMLMVPGFALLILGVAGAFVNGYIALDCLRDPTGPRRYAHQYVREFNNLDQQLNFNKKRKKDDEASEHELFMAAAGGGAGATVLLGIEEAMTDGWTASMTPVHVASTLTSLFSAVAGWCILRGRFYSVCLLGCLTAVLTIGQACCIPGMVAGLWGFLTLVRDDGRAHFGIRPKVG